MRFIKEKAPKRSLNDNKTKIRLLVNFRGKALEDLSRDFIMEEVSKLKCSDSTKNRYLIFIRALLNKCASEWEWIDKTPKLTFYHEPKRRIRFLTPAEVDKLIAVLPDLYADLVKFSFMTELRQHNILALEWSQVDMQRKFV